MRDPNRIDPLLEKLGEAWKKTPDWRFGQFMTVFFNAYGKDPFYAEDDAWMVGIQAYIDGANMAEAMDAHRKSKMSPALKAFLEKLEAHKQESPKEE